MNGELHIVVVGAGLAGLTAAYRLKQQGHRVEVYEARSRPGGRVLTAYFDDNYEELGGKSIDDAGYPFSLEPLIQELGLSLEIQDSESQPKLLIEGRIVPLSFVFEEAPEPTEAAFADLEAQLATAKSIGELLDRFLGKETLIRRVVERTITGSDGMTSYQLSPYNLPNFWRIYRGVYEGVREAAEGEQPFAMALRSVKGGNSRLVEALAAPLEKAIHFNSPLRKIARDSQKGFRLDFAPGNSVHADYVVLALPCSTLRQVELASGLFPEDQMRAIRDLPYGKNGKILLPVAGISPQEACLAFTDDLGAWFNANNSVLTLYYGAEQASFNPSDLPLLTRIAQRDLPAMKRLFPKMAFPMGTEPIAFQESQPPRYSRPVAISWWHEEFSQGSYASYGIQDFALFTAKTYSYGEEILKVFRPILHSLFFAGEHTAGEAVGTMEGAVRSGDKAARMIHLAITSQVASIPK